MVLVLQDPSGLAQGITGAGSALGQALQTLGTRKYEKEQKQEEIKRLRNLEEEKRLRTQKGGTVLQGLLSQLKPNASIKDVQGIMAQAIKQGVDPSIVQNFAQQYTPIIKEQARTQAAQSFLQNILGQGAPQGDIVEEGEISTPQGTVYEQLDGVPNGMTQSKIDALISSPYPELQALGKQYDNKRIEARKNFVEDRNFHAKGLAKTEENIEKLRKTLPRRERVLNLARSAIESGEIGQFSQNRIADIIGGPIGDALRTKSGAQFGLAAKENLVTNLGEISARGVNMFMEQRLLDAFSKVGQSEAANLAVQDFFEAENDIEKAYLKEYDRLAAEDERRFGYKRNDLAKRATEASKDEEQKIFNRSSVRQRQLQEREKGVPWMYKQTEKKVEKGTPLTPEMYRIFIEKLGDPEKALIRAKQLGYKIYPPNELAGGRA